MARIAYVDHSYHRKTCSTAFLVDILQRYGHAVDLFWDEAWKGGDPVNFDQVESYDIVIMFQSVCPTDKLYFRKIHPNVIHIPMLDQFGLYMGPWSNVSPYWEIFHGSKIISFSCMVHAMATSLGIKSFPVRYYQNPARFERATSSKRHGLNGFFWLRNADHVAWPMIRSLICDTKFDTLHIHVAPDPYTKSPVLPTADEIKKYNITTSTWFDNKEDFLAVLQKANVFFAARLEEGIGQSFLEAMSRGQCVVAPDNGTMNEYILHGVNGLLYKASSPRPLDFSRVNCLGEQAYQTVVSGYSVWESLQQELVDFILTPSEEFYRNAYCHPLIWNSAPCVTSLLTFRQKLKNSRIARKIKWLLR